MSNIPSDGNSKQAIYKEEYCRRQPPRRRGTVREKRQRRYLFFAGCAAVLLGVTVGVILLCKSFSLNSSVAASDGRLIGSYMLSDNSCTYTFKEDGSGYLRLAGGNRYNFTFSLTDTILEIDFENTAVSDSVYTVAFNGSELTLTATEGTVTPGKEYILSRLP